jgi:hypothetical protein
VFYLVSSDETAKELQKLTTHEEICEKIDSLKRVRLVCEIDESEVERIDYTVDLSSSANDTAS